MLRLIILLPTRIGRVNLSLLSIGPKALVMHTNTNSWTAVIWPIVLIESDTFLFYYLRLFLILNVEILTLLWILSFLTIANVLL